MSEMENVLHFIKRLLNQTFYISSETQTDELCSMTPGICINKGNGVDFDVMFTLKLVNFS